MHPALKCETMKGVVFVYCHYVYINIWIYMLLFLILGIIKIICSGIIIIMSQISGLEITKANINLYRR